MNGEFNNNVDTNNNVNGNLNMPVNEVNQMPYQDQNVAVNPNNVYPQNGDLVQTPVDNNGYNQMPTQNTDKKKYIIMWVAIIAVVIIIITAVIFITRGSGNSKSNGKEISELEYQDYLNSYGLEVNKLVTEFYATNNRIPKFDEIKGDLPKSDVSCDKNEITPYGIVELSNCHIKGIKYRSNLSYISENIDEFSFLGEENVSGENNQPVQDQVLEPATPENVGLDNAVDAVNQLNDMANARLNEEDYQYLMNDSDEEL